MLLANQAAFWRRDIHQMVGYLDEGYHCAFDYEWFLRLLKHVEGEHVEHFWGALRLHGETKTSLLASRFLEEVQRILAGREVPSWQKKLYKLRRLVVMLGQGRFAYAMRGIVRHARGRGGEHH